MAANAMSSKCCASAAFISDKKKMVRFYPQKDRLNYACVCSSLKMCVMD